MGEIKNTKEGFIPDKVAKYIEVSNDFEVSPEILEKSPNSNEGIDAVNELFDAGACSITSKVFPNSLEFISFYNDKTPPLKEGEYAYFVIFNVTEPHRPLIVYGRIEIAVFDSYYQKNYFFTIDSFYEPEDIIQKFVYKNQFSCYSKDFKHTKKLTPLTCKYSDINTLANYNFFAPSFFARKNWEEIVYVRNLYVQVVYNELKKDIQDLIDIQNL
jgi:hypothetical protein